MVTAVLRKDIDELARRPFAAILLLAALAVPFAARAQAPSRPCNTPIDLLRLAHPLARVGKKLTTGEPITIVAIGSSSTWGWGASSPAANYPNQLVADLKQRFPKQKFTVLNAGVGGEEVADMLKRFDTAVIAPKPDLVLWQLGTNAIISDQKASNQGSLISEGLRKIRSINADIVLIDPQFAPKVIAKPDAELMVHYIAATSKQEGIDLFRRYEAMKRWKVDENVPFETFMSSDGLHMNDWGYACMAKGLGMVIAEAAQRPIMSATARSHVVP